VRFHRQEEPSRNDGGPQNPHQTASFRTLLSQISDTTQEYAVFGKTLDVPSEVVKVFPAKGSGIP
jgi:hypothetical protein